MVKTFVHIMCALPAINAFSWSVLSAVIGTLILAGFFSLIMTLETLSGCLPMIVGANAAISGYMLIERAENEIKYAKTAAATAGVMVAILSVISVNTLCYQIGHFVLLSSMQAIVAVVIAVAGGWSGGVLAIKYQALKAQIASL